MRIIEKWNTMDGYLRALNELEQSRILSFREDPRNQSLASHIILRHLNDRWDSARRTLWTTPPHILGIRWARDEGLFYVLVHMYEIPSVSVHWLLDQRKSSHHVLPSRGQVFIRLLSFFVAEAVA